MNLWFIELHTKLKINEISHDYSPYFIFLYIVELRNTELSNVELSNVGLS